MKKNLFGLFHLLFVVLILFFLFNCREPSNKQEDDKEKEYSLIGYWKSSYGDGFEINSTQFYQYDDATKTVSYAGNIVNNPDLESGSDYITIEITDAGTWGKTVGEFYRVHWKEFTKNTVKESSAYKSGGASTMPSQATAETEFTVANGYFAYYGDYEKQ